jgi:hypothetical protein
MPQLCQSWQLWKQRLSSCLLCLKPPDESPEHGTKLAPDTIWYL